MIRIIIGEVFLIIGGIFVFLSSLGLIRMPDVYNRMQTSTKAVTLGAIFSIIGIGIIEPSWFVKGLLIVLFLLFTNPISAHSIGRASYLRGVKLWEKSVVDKFADYVKEKRHE
jgi:multicomponent Na+:H+ antiporter subunit G